MLVYKLEYRQLPSLFFEQRLLPVRWQMHFKVINILLSRRHFGQFPFFFFLSVLFFPHGCRRYMLRFIFILVQISISFVSKVFLTLSNLIHKNQQMSVAPLLWWLTIYMLFVYKLVTSNSIVV